MAWWLIFIAALMFVPMLCTTAPATREISWQVFEDSILARNAIEKINVVNNEYAAIYIKKELAKDASFKEVFRPVWGKEPYAGPHFTISIGSVESFERKLEAAETRLAIEEKFAVTFSKKESWFSNIIGWVLPIIVIIVLWRFMSRNLGGRRDGSFPFSFGKSTATLLDKENRSTVTFDDVAGLEEAEQEVREIVDFLKNPESFTRLGAKIPKGVILVGPPGTGKTLLAKAVAGEADFLDAIDRIVAGLEKKSKIISPEEKKIIAYHEAGHAVVSWLLKTVDPLVKVSIIPRGKSLGAAWYLPEEKQLRTSTAFYEHLSATLGGRAAEEVIFGDVSSGALDDLEKTTKEAYMMVAYYGFNEKIGTISFYDSSGQRDGAFQKPYSEDTGRLIDEEVRKLVNEAYQQAKNILLQNKESLHKVAALLLSKEVVFKEDLEKVLGGRKAGREQEAVAGA